MQCILTIYKMQSTKKQEVDNNELQDLLCYKKCFLSKELHMFV